MSKIIVTLQTLKTAVRFQSKDESRYYLKGVYFTQKEKHLLLVATDGHRMGILKAEGLADKFESFILPAHTIAALKPSSASKRVTSRVLIDTEKKEVSVTSVNAKPELDDFDILASKADMTIKYAPVEGTYPDFMRVVPDENKFPDKVSANGRTVNTDYLASFPSKSLRIFYPQDPQAPILLRFSERDHYDAVGLLMPMRGHDGPAMPYWLAEKKVKAVKKTKTDKQ